jgi:phosphoadenosine phosphosulfate reductase
MNARLNLDDPALLDGLARRSAAARELLRAIAADFSPAVFASSLGAEDMVLTDLIVREGLPIGIFSLDTGRLPAETHDLIATVRRHYGLTLRLYYPRHDLVEAWTSENGINAFYESVELRKGCCHVRKVEPLQRALAGQQSLDHRHAGAAGEHARRPAAAQRRHRQRRAGKVQPARRLERT